MPEGDTVHTIAAYLAPRLAGRTVRRLRTADPRAAGCEGRRVTQVNARGKHLLIALDNGLVLRSHLGMYGTWHRYGEGEPWRKPRWQASLELAAGDQVYVCFNAKEVELLAAAGVRERIVQARLGPDLADDGADLAQVPRRAREFLHGDTPLADVLLDQRVAGGIGNVYKSEVLFIGGRLPHTRLADVDDAQLAGLYATAADLIRRNLGGGPRVTRFVGDGAGRLWAYRRRDMPCLRCEDRIRFARLGADLRGTYWCPGCQR